MLVVTVSGVDDCLYCVVALFNLSNRMATVADMRPNDEFYGLGRGGD